MNNQNLLKIGIIGSVIAAICCFTPLLVVLFAALGISSMLGILDIILLPALAFFLLITVIAIIRRRKGSAS